MNKSLSKLTTSLGYTFTDLDLLKLALTHRSIGAQNNERLEFLGDSILNFIIAEVLYTKFAFLKEGELSRLRASLVNGETLAEIATELALSSYLILGPGELRSGGSQRRSILADTVEAIIGAIYLDSGRVDVVKIPVLTWFEARLELLSHQAKKDPKTSLQEYLQAKRSPLPTYDVISIAGDAHEQVFNVSCVISELNLTAQGVGSSRRRAEQAAALACLQQLGLVPAVEEHKKHHDR